MRYVFVDLETTGLKIPIKGGKGPFDEIIQIGAIATGPAPDFKELERIDLKVWPTPQGLDWIHILQEEKFPTVYDEKVWTTDGASRKIAFKRFQQFLKRHSTITKISKTKGTTYKVAQLIGYNVNFDKEFLFGEFGKEDLFLPARGIALDVMNFVAWLDALDDSEPLAGMKLVDVCKECGITLGDAHNAMADIEATAALARAMVKPFYR